MAYLDKRNIKTFFLFLIKHMLEVLIRSSFTFSIISSLHDSTSTKTGEIGYFLQIRINEIFIFMVVFKGIGCILVDYLLFTPKDTVFVTLCFFFCTPVWIKEPILVTLKIELLLYMVLRGVLIRNMKNIRFFIWKLSVFGAEIFNIFE